MKKIAIFTVVLALTLGTGITFVAAQDKSPDTVKPEKKMIIGEAVSLSTYAMEGGGEEKSEAMKYECEKGFPVGIIEEETGDLYVCVYKSNAPASHLETANEQMLEYMGKKVAAQGLVYTRENIKLIRLALVSEY